ncbi:MAG: macro domain-containing protein, partial [Bacteroidales bacterium]
MKVKFWDKRVMHIFYIFLSVISVVSSIIFLFVDIPRTCKTTIGIIVLILIILVYLGIWIYSNYRTSIKLKINNSEIEIKYGDIFEEQSDLKVIAFNEYFDTLVDDIVISQTSLNGIYINKYYRNNTSELDEIILKDTYIRNSVLEKNHSREFGKKIKYELGTICTVNDYLLTALTHFDNNNKAYLEMNDYINCLINFWNEIDRVYAGRTV